MSQVHHIARTCRALHLEGVAVEHVAAQERLDKQEVGCHPNRTAPVAVAAEKTAVGVAGQVFDLVLLAVHVHLHGVFLVELGQRSDTVRRKELLFVEHVLQDRLEAGLVDQRKQQTIILAADLHVGDVAACNIVAVLQEPLQALLEVGEPVNDLRLKCECSEQRDQTNQRADLHLVSPGTAPRNGVVVEAVLLVPERLGLISCAVRHGVRDGDEVLEELGCHILVNAAVLGQLQADVQHAKAVEAHPAGCVSLLESTAGGKRIGTVEETNVVQTEETTFKDVLALGILAVAPPSEVDQQLLEDSLEEIEILAAVHLALDLECAEDCPGVNRRVDVAKVPFIGGDLSVGVHAPFAGEEIELLLCESRIDHCERDAVKGCVPGGEEGVLPGVRHGENIIQMHVLPLSVANGLPLGRRWRHAGVAVRPLVPNEVVVLLAPHHASQCLALNVAQVVGHRHGVDLPVELVGLGETLVHDIIKLFLVKVTLDLLLGDAETHNGAATGRNTITLVEGVPGTALGAGLLRVASSLITLYDTLVEGILDVGRLVLGAPKLLEVGVVVGEEELGLNVLVLSTAVGRRRALEVALSKLLVLDVRGQVVDLLDLRLVRVVTPRPSVAEPDLRDDVQFGGFGAAVVAGHSEQQLLGIIALFCGLNVAVPVTALVEDSGIDEVVLALCPRALGILFNDLLVGELLLRQLVEVLHVRVGRRVVEVEVGFLDALSVVSLRI